MWQSELKKESAFDAFISYSSKNKMVVDALCHYLEENKIRCWMAPRDILPGQNYAEAIAQAMSKVKVFILVYSNFSLSSQWVQSETNLAVTKRKIIIPFRIEDCSFEGTAMELYLNDRHWIDAIPDPAKSFGSVAEAITSLIGTKDSTGTTTSQSQPEAKKKSQIPTSAEEESVIDSFLDHADACLVDLFLSAKSKERLFWIATVISFILIIVFMHYKWEEIGAGAFLFFLLFLPCGILFTIKAFIYSRKLAFPFEITYADLKKAYLKKANEMREAVESMIDSFLDHADAGVVERFLSVKSKERLFWIATLISYVLFIVFMCCKCENISAGAFLFFLLFLPCWIFFMIKAYIYSKKLAFPFEIRYTDLKKVYLKKAYEMRKAAVNKQSSSDCNG